MYKLVCAKKLKDTSELENFITGVRSGTYKARRKKLSELTVADLKRELEERDLNMTRLKAVLKDRCRRTRKIRVKKNERKQNIWKVCW